MDSLWEPSEGKTVRVSHRTIQIPTEDDVIRKLKVADENALGAIGEQVWSNLFRASGISYIPLAKIDNGGAPRIEDKGNGVVLPDFDCATPGWTVFVDSKCKSGPVLWRQTNQLRHGIDGRNYRAYKRASEIFQKQCGVAILELFESCETKHPWSGRLWIETLNGLGEPIPGTSNQSHMVYWPQKMFRNIDTLSPVELWKVHRGIEVDSYLEQLSLVFGRKSQKELF